MAKKFNITGTCFSKYHYMVNIDNKLYQIKKLIDDEEYFVINRARQYGKTTTLSLLSQYLKDDYEVISISFEGIDDPFETELSFSNHILLLLYSYYTIIGNDIFINLIKDEMNKSNYNFTYLSLFIIQLCKVSDKPIVLMIDEVDQASNQKKFLSFLGMLRNMYLHRMTTPTFQSVILAGVYDIKNLKLKIRNDEQHQYNSPWNIAVPFDIDMSFSPQDISTMLIDYENDYHTGMNIDMISHLIYDYTSGYPFLVSLICKTIDEKLGKGFTNKGILQAVNMILHSKNTLFDDMIKKLHEYPELSRLIYAILFNGQSITFELSNSNIDIGYMFGFIKDDHGSIAISNRIFETYLYNYYMSIEDIDNQISIKDNTKFLTDGTLDMKKVLSKFVEYYNDIYSYKDNKFLEKDARKLFLLYLKPIINGAGNYYIEPHTRDDRRTDIIVDYLGKQYIIELKIWRGEEYNKRGEEQLLDYLDYYHTSIGYMVSFNFNKNKTSGVKEIQLGDKILIEAVV